jgi:Zn-dependent metalloprotease
MRYSTTLFLFAFSLYSFGFNSNVIDSTNFYYQYSESQKVPWSGELSSPVKPDDFVEYFTQEVIKNSSVSFELMWEKEDRFGFKHRRYQQLYKGIQVKHGVLNLHMKNGLTESFNGEIYTQFTPESDVELDSNDLKIQPALSNFDFHELIDVVYVTDQEQKLHKSFEVHAGNHQPESLFRLYLNVYSGDNLRAEPLLIHADSTGKAVTHYRDTQTIVADYITADSFRLRQSNHPISVFHTSQGNDVFDKDNFWDNANERIAGDVMYGNTLVGDFLENEFNWDSYDGNGNTMVSLLNFSASGNATWNLAGNFATYFVNSTATVGPCASIDVVGHEVGHGIADENAGLVYTGESCMLHESFADIVGTLIEREGVPNTWDWIVGDQVWSGGIRDLSDPWNKNMPKYYQGRFWGGGCHSPGSVQNYWFYLVHHGDTGKNEKGLDFSIEGLGHNDAIQMTFRSMFYYVTANTDYEDIVKHTLKSAKDLFGTCSEKYTMVYDAWKVVGLEDTTMKGVDTRHGIQVNQLNCVKAPTTVPVKSIGDVARVVTWYFPNGDSAIAQDTFISVSKSGNYCVISKTEVCNFTFLDTADFVVQHQPKASFQVSETEFCVHHSDSFTATNLTQNTDTVYDLKYLWSIEPSNITSEQYDFTIAKEIDYDYDIVLKAYYPNGCSDDQSVGITMNPTPTPSFEANNGCLDEGIKIVNTSSDSKNLAFLWKFPDGTTSIKSNPSYLPSQSGTRSIQLIATHLTSGCVDSVSGTFEAYPLPNADFSFSNACYGEPITFIDQSVYDNAKAWNEWDFGIYKPFNKDTVQFTPASSGEVEIGLHISDQLGCENEIYKTVSVETLEALFTAANKTCAGDELELTHQSKGEITQVQWLVDGTSIGSSDTISWTTSTPGEYEVELKVSNQNCNNSLSQSIRFEPKPTASFEIPTGCSEHPATITSTGSQGENTSVLWTYGDNETKESGSLTLTKQVDETDSIPVHLRVENEFNCQHDTSGMLLIHPLPSCGFSSSHAGKANRVVLVANQSGEAKYEWTLGDGTKASGDSIEHTYQNDNRRIVSLTVTSPAGCSCSDSMPVNPLSLSARSIESSGVVVYPNPNRGDFNIKGVIGTFELILYDSKGSVVYDYRGSQTSFKTDLSTGLYWVLIRNRGELIHQSLHIE